MTLIRDFISPMSKITEEKEHVNKQGILSHTTIRFIFRNKHIIEKLNEYGLGYNKTYLEKRIRHLVPDSYMWDFIRGFFDGDGCVSGSSVTKIVNGTTYNYNNVGWTIVSKDRVILEEINDFFSENGILTRIYPNSGGCFLIGSHSKKELPKIYSNLYNECNFFLKRKKDKFEKIMGIPSQTTE